MSDGVRLPWPAVIAGGAALLLAGAGAAYLWLPRASGTSAANTATPGPSAPDASASAVPSGPLADVVIHLSSEAAMRAGIKVTPVSVSSSIGRVRLAGIVEADAYRQVVVAPLVSGRVTRVVVALGDHVRKGAPVAEIYSPELAEAQTRYLSMRAEFQAVEQEITRTNRLVEIGAASKQELERIHAEHVRHRTEVDSARTRLQLLGMTTAQVEALVASGQVAATTTVVSPINGDVTARTVNPGSTVDPASPLVTIVDLSTVWIVGDVYERDFGSVSVGSRATVTTTAFPELEIAGKVSFVDPSVRTETRTARIRVEVPNRGQRLKLGMYADVHVDAPSASPQLLIPRSAIQNVADRTVVYLKDPSGDDRFIEREVRISRLSDDPAAVLSGVMMGDAVVSAGSFFLRAERERLGLRGP
jgi:RND family efflux transporter MFP subunit